MLKFCKFMLGVAIISSAAAVPTHADAVVRVTLIDKSGMPDSSNSMRFGMGMHGDMKMARMGINISSKAVDRGKVKFDVTNLASKLVHEVILARIADENSMLSYNTVKNKVNEEMIKTLGQVAEIGPSKSASITLELKPGKYILYCNIAGHYMAGMWTVIEVK